MDLTVMICTWNNSQRLAITLDAISRCTIPDGFKWELVLVNNNCTDDTDELVSRFANKLPLVYVHEPQQGLSQARNTGLKASSGELIVFTDDDVKPFPGWIAAYREAYQEKKSKFYFGGPIKSEFEGNPLDNELVRFAPASVKGLNYGNRARVLKHNEFFIGPNWACPMEALKISGGFDTTLGLNPSSGRVNVGEEIDLMQRLRDIGLSPWYIPSASITHLVPASKCHVKHIAARIEARAFNRANLPVEQRSYVINGITRWMYKDVCLFWIKWIWAKITGKKGYREYINLRRMIGTMKGLHNQQQNSNSVSMSLTE